MKQCGWLSLNPIESGKRFERITPELFNVVDESLNPIESGKRFELKLLS